MGLDSEKIERNAKISFLLVAGIMLFASNLRVPITSIGSLVPVIRDNLEVSSSIMGSISTLPLLAFAFVSPFVPKLANRIGMEKTIFLAMMLLGLGIVVRSANGISTLFIGTALIGITIAFGNVLLPGLIKMRFPFKVGLMTGLYTIFMNIFGALASGVSVPLSNIEGFGWRVSLGIWVTLILIAIIFWYPQVRNPQPQPELKLEQKKAKMWTSATAWYVTIFMGFQSLMYLTPLTWLPDILQSHGFSLSQAGLMISVMLLGLIPVNFIIPVLADRMKNQKLLGAFTGIVFFLGSAGLFSSNLSILIISALLIGVGCGSGYSLSMMFFTLRTKNGYEASDLSGMAQSIGYLIAATGPIAFGGFYDVTGSWTAPIIILMAIGIIIVITGVLAGRDIVIDSY
ncbi:CynX/NimT family MFS transporter [Oceanobacillus alkalisoli]|uniref:CynX/NimT family MFS transporter n=1 Tax=Oceanobacillus alkalisoli TaxID=2925113 RepID=UPI001EE4C045|nr:MFS transporter [Oceanobacillus alkalisoli]MCG5104191.1 MFS transporter [Oceanobacillus alkalisoli]